jgi:HK97 gp10 family phage protein
LFRAGGVMAKKGIKYQSNTKQVKYLMSELERAALKESAKFLRKEMKSKIPVDEGILKKNVGTWVKRKDGSLQIGIYTRQRAKRKGYKYAFHAHLVEFGTKKTRAQPFLRNTVMENIDQLRIIQGQFLKEIEDENRARGLIKEEEEIADD